MKQEIKCLNNNHEIARLRRQRESISIHFVRNEFQSFDNY